MKISLIAGHFYFVSYLFLFPKGFNVKKAFFLKRNILFNRSETKSTSWFSISDNQQEGKSEEETPVTLPSKRLTPPPQTVQCTIHQSTHLHPTPSTVCHTLTTAGDIKIYMEKSAEDVSSQVSLRPTTTALAVKKVVK